MHTMDMCACACLCARVGEGVYGQMLYISREHGVVIAKNAAYPHYASKQRPNSHENFIETQGYQAMRAMASHFSNA